MLRSVVMIFAVCVFASMPCFSAPRLSITPRQGLIDEPLVIVVDGLAPEQTFIVRAVMRVDAQTTLASHGLFRADDHGLADVGRQNPLEGTYKEGEMGLLWSMNATDVPDRLRGSDLPVSTSSLEPYTVLFELEIDGKVTESVRVERRFARADVKSIDIQMDGLVARLFIPAAKNKLPAIVLVGGSEGGLETGAARGMLLASRGYVTLAVAYFRAPGLPGQLVSIPVETIGRACEYLSHVSIVDSRRIGIIGSSRGAELALLAASAFSQIKAVVAYSPSNATWAAIATGPQRPAWTIGNTPVPFVPNPPADLLAGFRQMTGGLPPRTLQGQILAYSHEVERAEIPVERINGPILLVSGQDDRLWPSSVMADLVVARMKERDSRFSAEHLTFPDAGHIINFPFMPASTRTQLGGTVEGLARADRESWERVVSFLSKNLQPNKTR